MQTNGSMRGSKLQKQFLVIGTAMPEAHHLGSIIAILINNDKQIYRMLKKRRNTFNACEEQIQ
jgi:hypothetical protein